MSSIIPRKGFWHIQYTRDGKKVHKSTRIRIDLDPEKKLAKQVQRNFDTDAARAAAGLGDVPMTIAEGLAGFISARKSEGVSEKWVSLMKLAAREWVEFFKRVKVSRFEDITPGHVNAFLVEKRKALSEKTLKMKLIIFRSTVRMVNENRVNKIKMAKWPVIKRTPTRNPERIGGYAPDEVARLLAYFEGNRRRHWLAPVLFLAYTGCRYSEMARAKVGDVRAGRIRIESKKTATNPRNQFRMVELHPRLVEALAPILQDGKPGDRIFPGAEKKYPDLVNVFRRACKKLGIQYRRVHGLRHTWITQLLMAGTPVPVVMTMCGHRDLQTTLRYLDLPDGATSGYLGALDAFSGVSPAQPASGSPAKKNVVAPRRRS
ncbi:MAG: site-specific integrase [Candidatus Riflebacteria bacterium]|nr:site-specific integrase [Candidatus Riflebacteria bacterium]